MHHNNALFWGALLTKNPGIDSCFHPQVDIQLKFILGLSNLGTLFCGIDWFMTVQSLFITRWCAPLRELHVVLWLLPLLLLRKRPLSEVISKTNEDKTDEVNPEFTSVTKSWTPFPPGPTYSRKSLYFRYKGRLLQLQSLLIAIRVENCGPQKGVWDNCFVSVHPML